jgi:glycosyltransferase involved in cell wall biosynthesis
VSFLLSEALPNLANRRNDWIYLIAGDGPERKRIEAAVAHSELEKVVRVLGQVSDDELRAAYALADLFVMPNVRVEGDCEGFGLVTLEARAAGLPVVASSLEGISDSFLSADECILVPPGDAEAFAEAIDCLLQPDLLTLEARLRRRARVKSRYDWTHIAEEYLAVFRDVQVKHGAAKTDDTP